MAKKSESETQILGRLLRAARESSGVTQADIAIALGVDQSLVSRQESGDSKLDYLQVFDYLDVIGCSFHKFATNFERELRINRDS